MRSAPWALALLVVACGGSDDAVGGHLTGPGDQPSAVIPPNAAPSPASPTSPPAQGPASLGGPPYPVVLLHAFFRDIVAMLRQAGL